MKNQMEKTMETTISGLGFGDSIVPNWEFPQIRVFKGDLWVLQGLYMVIEWYLGFGVSQN